MLPVSKSFWAQAAPWSDAHPRAQTQTQTQTHTSMLSWPNKRCLICRASFKLRERAIYRVPTTMETQYPSQISKARSERERGRGRERESEEEEEATVSRRHPSCQAPSAPRPYYSTFWPATLPACYLCLSRPAAPARIPSSLYGIHDTRENPTPFRMFHQHLALMTASGPSSRPRLARVGRHATSATEEVAE